MTDALDAIVLDVNLPDGSGFDVCRTLRETGVRTPILMLTARDAVADRVEGLDAGADDYLVKPFATAFSMALSDLARSYSSSPSPSASSRWMSRPASCATSASPQSRSSR